MTPERKAKLVAAGHRVMSSEDFFGLDETDRKIVACRLALSGEIHRLCEELGLTHQQLAERIKNSQTRVASIQKGQTDDLDAILTAYVALGGKLPDLALYLAPKLASVPTSG